MNIKYYFGTIDDYEEWRNVAKDVKYIFRHQTMEEDPEFKIRDMVESDIDEALLLWKDVLREEYLKHLDTYNAIKNYLIHNKNFSSVACTREGKLVGTLLCEHDGWRGSIYHTAVNREYRYKAIGHRMQMCSMNKLREAGVTTGFLYINENNSSSFEFWEAVGFKACDDIRCLHKDL